jgi:hypothetical protein
MGLAMTLALLTTACGGVCCVLAIVGLRRGENFSARRCAKYSVWSSAAFLPLITAASTASAVGSSGPESKAYYLARGISEAMNAGALNIPIGIIACVLWIVARRRLASTSR